MSNSRAPQGARGLKFHDAHIVLSAVLSRPARGAWVEMLISVLKVSPSRVAPRKGRVG